MLYELQYNNQNWSSSQLLKLSQAGAPALVGTPDRIYAIGGWEASRADDQGQQVQQDNRAVLAIDPVKSQVTAFAQLPTASHCMWALAHQGYLYSIGGFQTLPGQGLSATADILKISLSSGSVEKLGQLPSGRSFGESFSCEGGGSAAVVFKNQIVIAGGYQSIQTEGQAQGRRLAEVLAIDPTTGRVSLLAELPSPRSGVALAVFQDKLYAVGGHDGVSALIDVLEIQLP